MKRMTNGLAVLAATLLASLLFVSQANAAAVLCSNNVLLNHMSIDDSQVNACLASGVGNLTGNPANDEFLLLPAGADYELASKSDEANPFNILYTQNGDTGTWSFDSSFWDSYETGAIGFKFGTGNTPDEWFVYELKDGISSGDWEFISGLLYGQGGGLSHVNLYGIRGSFDVPEPGTLGLMGMGILLLGLSRRRKSA
ncbi:PEP-CTERM sorting domain-containing protein [Marinobacter mobilis]|uniref:PEP-CTERM sorting domain-containing protein n=1 Tax=Marinobacter mobilis TaxID=488533 RepID=UPI0035C77F38